MLKAYKKWRNIVFRYAKFVALLPEVSFATSWKREFNLRFLSRRRHIVRWGQRWSFSMRHAYKMHSQKGWLSNGTRASCPASRFSLWYFRTRISGAHNKFFTLIIWNFSRLYTRPRTLMCWVDGLALLLVLKDRDRDTSQIGRNDIFLVGTLPEACG